MGGLKFFNKDTYESIGDAFKAIKQELLSLCPKDSSSVRWQRGVDGMSATVNSMSSSSVDSSVQEEDTRSAYDGFFAVKRDTNGIFVTPGYTDLGEFSGGYLAEGDLDLQGMFILLVAKIGRDNDRFSIRTGYTHNAFYEPGETISEALALIGTDGVITQINTQGIIYFAERYYIDL